LKVFTIGVYGWTAETFARAIKDAKITSVVDIRRRRGVRGPSYRFANAKALERLVTGEGIMYVSVPALAPTQELRSLQKQADREAGIAKKDRAHLSSAFVDAYRSDILAGYSREMLNELLATVGERPAFLCVEREAAACHRGIFASWVAEQTGCQVVNLTP
jgi:uncharacterized protein (DUF488 family)